MVKNFKEYFNLSKSDVAELWSGATIVLDTNVILNIYRYSEITNRDFLKVLESYKERLWLPFQVGKEFHRRRITVIEQQIKSHDDASKNTKMLEELFKNKKRNPFLSDDLLDRLTSVFEDVHQELKTDRQKYESRLSDDDLLTSIVKLFENKIGNPYADNDLEFHYKQAQDRYSNKTPPGYEDSSKSENIYGDYIVWRQILDKAKDDKQNILFVTDDAKDDWWQIVLGKTLGPRIELKKEFHEETGMLFHMYNPFSFIKHATKNISISVSSNSLDEIKKLTPYPTTEDVSKKSIIVSATMRKTSLASTEKILLENLGAIGYDLRSEIIDETVIKIFFSVPNIPDLPRRIRKTLLTQIESWGYELTEFAPIT